VPGERKAAGTALSAERASSRATDRAGARASDNTRQGIALMVAAMLGFAALDGLRKALSADVPISIIVVSRYLTFFVLVLLWLRRDGRRLLRSGHVALQLLRSTVMVVEAALFVYALRYASLADASAAFALAPVAGVLLAILILGERAQRATWLALSLAGILIMLRPSAHSRPLGIWLALLSAVLYAFYGVLTRRVSDLDNARTSFAYMTLVGLLLAAIFAAVQAQQWQRPTEHDGLLLVLAALAAGVGQYLLISAYGRARAESLQPYTYFLFVWSVLISIVFFSAPPGLGPVLGTLLVIGAGSLLFAMSRRQSASAR
jgi:RarD protein